jgi:MFS family permease
LPARQVIMVDFVGRHRVDKAVSLFEVSLSLSRMAGPALGGVLLDVLGPRTSPGWRPSRPRSVFFAITIVMAVLVAFCWRPLHRDALDASLAEGKQ